MVTRLFRIPVVVHGGLTLAACAAFMAVKTRLDASYAAARHPVDYATGQLAFSAERIEEYYAVMMQAGTLDIYWRTQMIDFGFIASIALLSVLLGTLAGRIGRPGTLPRRMGIWTACAGLAGAGFDAIENLLSFAMLARPEQIPTALAVSYSAAAAFKFALLTAAMALLVATVIVGLASRLRRA